MSADPSSFNFDTGLSNIGISDPTMGLNTSGLGTNVQPFDPQGPINESDLIGGGSSGVSGLPQVPNLNQVTVSGNLGTIDPSTIGNPFAGPNGGPPLTGSNFSPSMTNIGFDSSNLTSSLGSELGLSGGGSSGGSSSGGSSGSSGGLFGGNLLNDAALMGLGYYGLSQAKSAQSQVNQEIAPLQSESQAMLGESKSLLADYNAGKLPSWAEQIFSQTNGEGQKLISNYNNGKLPASEQQQLNGLDQTSAYLLNQWKQGKLPGYAQSYVNWTSQEATNLLQANPTKALEQLAQQNFTDYNSGQLKPADEMQLDQQVQAEKARIQQLYAASGDANSTAMQAQFQQINNNAAIQRQQILNSYFQTGDKAYNSWISTNAQAAQIKASGAAFANSVFSQILQSALQTQEFAANYDAQNLQAELQAGTQLTEYSGTFKQHQFQDMLTGANQAATIGSQDLSQAIGIQLQSDENLSKMVGSLMQSIATAYSYSAYQRNNGAGGGYGYGGGGAGGTQGAAGGAASTLGAVVGDITKYGGVAAEGIGKLFGGASGQAAGKVLGFAGEAAGVAGAAFADYQFVKNWQSGNTGSDILSGAEAGASTGAAVGMVVPGIGTAVGFVAGAIIGAVVGGISSAFGGGRNDPETLNWNNIAPQLSANAGLANTMTPSQAYQSLAGLMDAKDNSRGHSTNMELKFGRMGEGKVMSSMASWVNQAIKSGSVAANTDPVTLFNKVVKPKLQQMGAYINPNDIVTSKGTRAGQSVDAVLTRLLALWQAGNLNSSTPVGIDGQTIGGLPQYGA